MAPSLPTGWGETPIVATATPLPINPAAGPVDHRNAELTDGPRHAARGAEAAQAPWSAATRGRDANDDPAPPAWFATGPDRQ
jgi:hypothetical protein